MGRLHKTHLRENQQKRKSYPISTNLCLTVAMDILFLHKTNISKQLNNKISGLSNCDIFVKKTPLILATPHFK